MSPSSLCYECKHSAYIKCLHCSRDFCRLHFREHEETISNDMQPLIDRLNNLTEQNLQIEQQKIFLINELNQWQQTAHRMIDEYAEQKSHEIEQRLDEYKKQCYDKLQKMKEQIKPSIGNEFNIITDEQRQVFENRLDEFEKIMNENMPLFRFNSLSIDSKLISFIDKTSISLLLQLKTPKRSCAIKFDASPMTTDGRFILLQDTTYSLGLYEYDTLLLHRQIPWSSVDLSNIIDLHWSYHRQEYLILTRQYVYALDKNFSHREVLDKKSKDFRTMTTDDEHDLLFIASSTMIEEFSLSTFRFSKRYNTNEDNIYSLRFNSNINQFGLTTRKSNEHKWYFEVRNRSMIVLWSIVTPIENGSCLASILFNYNQWIIVNYHGDILFQIDKNGRMKSEVIYAGRNLLNAIENKKLLIIRTFGCLEQHVL